MLVIFVVSVVYKLGMSFFILFVLIEDLKEVLSECGEWQQEVDLMV